MSWLSDFIGSDGGAAALFEQAGILGDQGLAQMLQGFQETQLKLDENTQSVLAGYDRGIAETDRIGRLARQRVMEENEQRFAQAGQQAAARGLDNTTVRDGYEQSAIREGNRGIAEVNTQIGGLRSSLLTGKAQFEAGLGTRDAGFMERSTMATSDWYRHLMDAVLAQAGVAGQNAGASNQAAGQAIGSAAMLGVSLLG